jgi:putative transposase
MDMHSIRTISCKLQVTNAQAAQLETTLRAFAEACNFVAEWGRTHQVHRQYALHKGCYAAVRQRFGLSANLAVRALARVAARLTKAQTRHSTFQPTSVDYDARIFRFFETDGQVGLTLVGGRQRLALKVGDFQRHALSGQAPTSATLCKKRKGYYLDIQVKEPLPVPDVPTGTLGVDLGLRKIVTRSDGISHAGATLNTYRLKRHRTRRSLQSKADTGTPSTRKNARRVLKRLSGKERRYQQWVNHHISKHIVEAAKEKGQAIALEDLTGIRQRTNKRLRKSQRGLHNTWAFYQLRQFIEYKAARAGVQVIPVHPAWTSQMCSSCLHMGARSREQFVCSNCGNALDADVNGALNIATVGVSVIAPEYSLLSCPLPQWAAEAAG